MVVSAPHVSQDVFVMPLTRRLASLLPGEFELADWHAAGLNVAAAAKRGVYTVRASLVAKALGSLVPGHAARLNESLLTWLGLSRA